MLCRVTYCVLVLLITWTLICSVMDGLLVWATGPPDRAGHEPSGLSSLPVYLPVLSCTCTTSSGAVGMS
ncbi:hypothetical protein GGI35DRAFT_454007 [Trichoderma velutinum]